MIVILQTSPPPSQQVNKHLIWEEKLPGSLQGMPARQGRGGGRAGPALQRAESLLLFEPHPNLHYLPLGGRGHTREGMISPRGVYSIPKTERGTSRAWKLWVQTVQGDALLGAPLGPRT